MKLLFAVEPLVFHASSGDQITFFSNSDSWHSYNVLSTCVEITAGSEAETNSELARTQSHIRTLALITITCSVILPKIEKTSFSLKKEREASKHVG
jgi:hypothetical protein